jgi:aminopeptidase N
VARADEYLRVEQPGPALRRMLLEGRDSVARALRGQARDSA